MADGAHLPVEDADDTGLSRVEDHVVELVVAVDEGGAVGGLEILVAEVGEEVVEVGDVAHGDAGGDVFYLGLDLLSVSCRGQRLFPFPPH